MIVNRDRAIFLIYKAPWNALRVLFIANNVFTD